MKNIIKYLPFVALVVLFLCYLYYRVNDRVHITYPFNKTQFPPEFPAPTFKWVSKTENAGKWFLKLENKKGSFTYCKIIDTNHWTPGESLWDSLKIAAGLDAVSVSVKKANTMGTATIQFSFSADSVAAPILYRQMPIPFVVAEKQLDSMNYVLINIGYKGAPHIAMKGFAVCGNCHSFTNNGSHIGLDLDAGIRDKGGYFVASITDSAVFDSSSYMSWTKIENRKTFGLFSKLSPDGRYIVTTVKDRVISHNFPYEPDNIAFSQLFFPVNGHLAIYDRQLKILKELPGANSNAYVQSNATWSPDGRYIVFCRAKALAYHTDSLMISIKDDQLIDDYLTRKRTFKYDICVIPFNNGRGGVAQPLQGASTNGKSNYFPAVSPNGKWIVYCEAENFMLLQPDSKLYIVPFEGGKSRKLMSNLPLFNSWHAWSPNGKWLTFVSKGFSIYTDLFLTHIDDEGNASPPVLVDKARQPRKVVNYPEFININPEVKFKMVYDYVELVHIYKALEEGDNARAKQLYFKLKAQHNITLKEDLISMQHIARKLGLEDEVVRLGKATGY